METTITTSMVMRATIYRVYFSFVLLIMISACSDKPKIIQHMERYTGAGHNEVYVVSHTWHTGFVMPSVKVYESMPALEERFGPSVNIEFGWGDRKFYQAEEITTGLALRAILWPTETVVHAVAVPENLRDYFANSQMELLCLNDAELSSLVTFISNSFKKNQSGEVELLAKGIYGDSQFYKGAGDYHLFNTCNEWTAKGLKSIGMDILPATKLTAESVMNYLGENSLRRKKAAVPEMTSGCTGISDK
jgi:uncharacterized protein (TIGR02117 family)